MPRPRLKSNWRRDLARLWRSKSALSLAAVAGLYAVWPSLNETVPTWAFVIGGISLSVVIVAGTVLKLGGDA